MINSDSIAPSQKARSNPTTRRRQNHRQTVRRKFTHDEGDEDVVTLSGFNRRLLGEIFQSASDCVDIAKKAQCSGSIDNPRNCTKACEKHLPVNMLFDPSIEPPIL